MTVPLPDQVVDALNKLSATLAQYDLKLANIHIERHKRAPTFHTYLLATPGGVVTVKKEL